jgi:hypothetical protein
MMIIILNRRAPPRNTLPLPLDKPAQCPWK